MLEAIISKYGRSERCRNPRIAKSMHVMCLGEFSVCTALGREDELTNRPPAHIESCSEDIYHGESCDTSGRWTLVLGDLGTVADVLHKLVNKIRVKELLKARYSQIPRSTCKTLAQCHSI